LSFRQHYLILEWHKKFKNVPEVQRQWTHKFETTPPTAGNPTAIG